MKTLKILLKQAFILAVVMCCFSCGRQYIPWEKLDGKILTNENGKHIKLEWQKGQGENWRFLEEVMVMDGKDTIKEWRYIE